MMRAKAGDVHKPSPRSTSCGSSVGDEAPVAVGTIPQGDDVAVVTLERPLDDATTFAVTVESERVDAPTSDPVLVASLEG